MSLRFPGFHGGLSLLKVVLKLALGDCHVVKEVGSGSSCRENAYSAHWFVFSLFVRFRPQPIRLYLSLFTLLFLYEQINF